MEVDQPSVSGEVSYLKSRFQKHLEEEGDGRKSEVDKYLEEAWEKDPLGQTFDMFTWWKVNSSRFVIDEFKSSLTP